MKLISDCGLQSADLLGEARPRSPLPALQSSPVDHTEAKKQQVARDFESVLLTKLFDQVQQSLGQWDTEDDAAGMGRQVQGLFWFCLAQDVADQGGLGLWKEIYGQLQRLDEVPNAAEVLNHGV